MVSSSFNTQKFIVAIATLIALTFIFPTVPLVASQEQLMPSLANISNTELLITGTVIDNYANISYTYPLTNQANITREYNISVPVFSSLLLSNVSIIGSNYSLWGKVYEIKEAEEIYNQTVEQNLTGAIIYYRPFDSSYFIRFNLKGNESVNMTIYFEGMLVRTNGAYSLQLANSLMLKNLATLNLNISIHSNLANFVGLNVRGLNSAQFSGDTSTFTVRYSGPVVQREDMVLSYSLTNYSVTSSILTYNNGTNNFFSYFLAPKLKTETSGPRQFVFVIDKSGSMEGQPLTQAKEAFKSIITTLAPTDQFNVLSYNDQVDSLWQESRPASSNNRLAAINFVDQLQAGGSTNIYDAIVDGLKSFVGNDYLDAMLFLSDGHPTAGSYQETNAIVTNIKEQNTKQISISTIAFGDGADFNLMSQIAAQNNGLTTRISTSTDAATEILKFYSEQFTANVLHWTFAIDGSQALNFKQKADNLFINGSEIIITGLFDSSIEITVDLQYSDENETSTVGANAPSVSNPTQAHIERAWAIQRIDYLINNDNTKDAVIALALYYGLTVETYTAMVLTELETDTTTDELARNAVTTVTAVMVSNNDALFTTVALTETVATVTNASYLFLVPTFVTLFLFSLFITKKWQGKNNRRSQYR